MNGGTVNSKTLTTKRKTHTGIVMNHIINIGRGPLIEDYPSFDGTSS